MLSKSARVAIALVLLIAVPVAFAGCGKSKKKTSAANVSTDAKIAAEVPAKIKSKGTLKVAADATYPPNEFIQGGRVVGWDPELAKALGQVMGLKVNVVNATFDAIIPGLAAKKYDIGMSSFTDTKEREATVDFVTYLIAGTEFFVKTSGGPTINTAADLCGHTVAAEKGTTQADVAAAQTKKCKAGHKPALKTLLFPDQNGANLALSSGRADVGMADSPVADYFVTKGQFKITGKVFGTAPYGIAIPKNNGMARPMLDALKSLISKGTYTAILQKWKVRHFAIKNPKINGAIN